MIEDFVFFKAVLKQLNNGEINLTMNQMFKLKEVLTRLDFSQILITYYL